jgi:cold shock CspA family protein
MAKSKETFNKREKEKKRQQQKVEKREKMEQRKANSGSSRSLDDMMAYLDENGNLTSTPPDPRMRKVFNAEDIQIGVPKYEATEEEVLRTGVVNYFSESKGFGFIVDSQSNERVFVHIKQLTERIAEGDKVQFETEQGPKGLNAINLKRITK